MMAKYLIVLLLLAAVTAGQAYQRVTAESVTVVEGSETNKLQDIITNATATVEALAATGGSNTASIAVNASLAGTNAYAIAANVSTVAVLQAAHDTLNANFAALSNAYVATTNAVNSNAVLQNANANIANTNMWLINTNLYVAFNGLWRSLTGLSSSVTAPVPPWEFAWQEEGATAVSITNTMTLDYVDLYGAVTAIATSAARSDATATFVIEKAVVQSLTPLYTNIASGNMDMSAHVNTDSNGYFSEAFFATPLINGSTNGRVYGYDLGDLFTAGYDYSKQILNVDAWFSGDANGTRLNVFANTNLPGGFTAASYLIYDNTTPANAGACSFSVLRNRYLYFVMVGSTSNLSAFAVNCRFYAEQLEVGE